VAASLLVMGFRRYAFLLVCALLGSAVAVLPAVAGSETAPTVNAESSAKTCGTYYPNCWSPSQVELASPGSVAFQNSSGVAHGVVWASVPAAPTCTGVPVDSSAMSFSGTCTFPQTGTYRFYCYVHGPSMSGTITVNPSGATTTTTTGTQPASPTTTTSTLPSATTSTPTGGSGSASSPAEGMAAAVSLARSQRGRAVRGSVQVPSADAGGRLEVDLLASRASIAGARAAAPARLGRVVRSSLHAGKLSFSVPLNARARGALVRHRRLALTVKIVLTPLQGSPSSTTRRTVLHP
jgi:plastocyanin